MSDSVRPHRQQPIRLHHPWDSPGKNTGVGCHFLLQCMKVKSESEVAQSCPTLSNPTDCSLPGSSVHGIFQARVLEWVAIAFSVVNFYLYIKWNPNLTWLLMPHVLIQMVPGGASLLSSALCLIHDASIDQLSFPFLKISNFFFALSDDPAWKGFLLLDNWSSSLVGRLFRGSPRFPLVFSSLLSTMNGTNEYVISLLWWGY